ncbi:MAG: hypothetical protein QOJ64_2524 [Acidobacteriota bacterium]|jgi:hypothetical protein|nr:hypothetical protein [Acidobacteriota bacterium]
MKNLLSAFLAPVLLVIAITPLTTTSAQEAAKAVHESADGVNSLTNLDVLRMVKAEFTPTTIVAQINSSSCNFETTPVALQQLRGETVPDAVIVAMVMAPKAAAIQNHPTRGGAETRLVSVNIPSGLSVEVEAPFAVSSQDVREGDSISFRVANPVKVNGVVVIAPGATATARVVKASRGGHFGRAGRLSWIMRDVTAVDGTRIPLQTTGKLVGDSKGAKVATAMVVTGMILWVAAPIALLHGFKRGENAVLPAGKRLEVSTQGEATIQATAP